ncbi:conserved hypothetical protein [Virus Rctr85]|nr:conserved hypothetical protein [Virus Rctr85]
MKFVDQTRFGNKEGNCLAACLASLFELDIDDVPDFNALHGDNWYSIGLTSWLSQFGLVPVMLASITGEFPQNCHYLVGGESPRGILHSCIGLNGEIVHDPHPSRAGLVRIDDYTFFIRSFV